MSDKTVFFYLKIIFDNVVPVFTIALKVSSKFCAIVLDLRLDVSLNEKIKIENNNNNNNNNNNIFLCNPVIVSDPVYTCES